MSTNGIDGTPGTSTSVSLDSRSSSCTLDSAMVTSAEVSSGMDKAHLE